MKVNFTRRRALFALLVVGLASAAAGAGTMALFSDTEQSTGNTVSAGTLDLTTESASEGALFQASNLAPTENTSGTFQVNNDGSLDGSLDVNVSYTESDSASQPSEFPTDLTADEYAKNVTVKEFSLSGDDGDSLSKSAIQNDGGDTTLYDLAHTDEETLGDVALDSGNSTTLTLDLELQDVGNAHQADGVNVTITFDLNQNDGQ